MRAFIIRIFRIAGLLYAIACVNANAASVTAETQICNGLYGSAEAPRLACASGGAGGGGGVIIGGSGAGSGIDSPFYVDQYGKEFSANAEAQQDYGVFHGYATIHVTEQQPNLFGGAYRAFAAGESRDNWTIGGGVGAGLINFSFTIDGGATGAVFVAGGNGSEGAQSDLGIILSMSPANKPNQTATLCCVTTAGTYVLNAGTAGGLNFIYGEPFDISTLTFITVGGGYDRLNPPTFFQLDATASFAHTATLTGIIVTDLFGNPVTNFSVSAVSGVQYPLTATVPLPASYALLLLALGAIRPLSRRRPDVRS